jgi:hypothetical protein
MRIVLGKIDAVPAAGGLMAVRVQANLTVTQAEAEARKKFNARRGLSWFLVGRWCQTGG